MVTISEKELSILAQLALEMNKINPSRDGTEIFGSLMFDLYAFKDGYGKDEPLIGEEICTPTTKSH